MVEVNHIQEEGGSKRKVCASTTGSEREAGSGSHRGYMACKMTYYYFTHALSHRPACLNILVPQRGVEYEESN